MTRAPIVGLFVRPPAASDEAAVLALLRELHLAERGERLDDEALRALFSGCDFLVAQAGGEIVGTLAFEIYRPAGFVPAPGHALTMAVAVAFDWRRRGVGRRLFARLSDVARAQGCAGVRLYVREANAPALAFYRSLGFSSDGEALTLALTPP